jgi:transcription initiation factor TFIIE subunit alpha
MQRFNGATSAIRDALRLVEGQRLPSMNVIAWIAQNVKSDIPDVAGGEASGGGEGRKVEVVIGEMGERERIEKERQAEAQR